MEAEEMKLRSRPGKTARRDQHDDMDDTAVLHHPWQRHPASRIFRVSRASGGKDRHSKVYTSKGLRDRRVRLSVSTAIQFYDLQDRLGYDQPSKAIEWLIKAADRAIAGLPTLDSPFAPLQIQGKPPQLETDDNTTQQQQQQQLSKSGCSSTSETSKGSVLSLSRSENRVKARDRARERALKDRDDNNVATAANHHQIINSQGSFTDLLTGNNRNGAAADATTAVQKQFRYMPATSTANYLTPIAYQSSSSSSGYLGNGSPIGMVLPFNIAAAAAGGDHPGMQHFSFSQDHAAIPIAAAIGDYNLNFSFSPGLAGFNRGTLQSNSPSQLPYHHLPRLPSPADNRLNIPFFGSTTNTPSSGNQFPAGLQSCFGDGYRHRDLNGKEQN